MSGVAGLTAADIPSLVGSYFPATSTVAIAYGGTGTSTAPSYGNLLVGNARGPYDLLATSSLGITGGGSGSVGSGTQGQLPFYNAAGTTLTATSSLFLSQSGKIGIGTTTPAQVLTISGSNGVLDNYFIAALQSINSLRTCNLAIWVRLQITSQF